MSKVAPSSLQAFHIFAEEYNSYSKVLKLALLLADFDVLDSSLPEDYVIDQLNELYQQNTIEALEIAFGLAEIGAGETFKDFETRVTIFIYEDYLLREIQPSGYIPASVVDPNQLNFLKYKKILLVYTHKPDFPDYAEFDPTPADQSHRPILYPSYPSGLANSWPPPDISGALTWHTVWSGYPGYSPGSHWRYRILAPFYNLIAANPSSSDYWMQEEVMDCFRESTPDDGNPWYSEGNPTQYISKGINDSWYDTYVELRDNRGYAPNAYRREQRWLSGTDYSYRLIQPGGEDHVQIQAWPYSGVIPIYKRKGGGGGGGRPRQEVVGVEINILPLSSAISSIKYPYSMFFVNEEQFIVNSENFEVNP
jgi:hypothetical protein